MRGPTRLGVSRRAIALAIASAIALTIAGGAFAGARAGALTTGAVRARLHHQNARAAELSRSVGDLGRLIAKLGSDIDLVRTRELGVGAELARDRAALGAASSALAGAQLDVTQLGRRLAVSQRALAAQLRSAYETDPPDIVSVVLGAHGFGDLLERLDFLRFAQEEKQTIITTARIDRRRARSAAQRFSALQMRDRQITNAVAAQAQAIAAMQALLSSRRADLRAARAAQQIELAHVHGQSHRLARELAKLQADQTRPVAAFGPTAGWAIPYAIVLCESGGQNLPPNSAGASGYYQFLPATWKGLGGSTPAAYLASKAEQDRLAARLWDGGRGASNWVCASIVASA